MNRTDRKDDKQTARPRGEHVKSGKDAPHEREKSINGGHQGSTGQRDKHDR